jgi:hypothetical protein
MTILYGGMLGMAKTAVGPTGPQQSLALLLKCFVWPLNAVSCQYSMYSVRYRKINKQAALVEW